MNVGSVLKGILKSLFLGALAAVAAKLGDPSTFAGLGEYAAIGVAVGLFIANYIAEFLNKQAPAVARFFGVNA